MLRDPELSALLDQAARNLETLELLARRTSAGEQHALTILDLRERLRELKQAYTEETDALTQQVLKYAIERRKSRDRRQADQRPQEATPHAE